ncbi:hypothetical protein Tco_0457111, partial [Tanacetum coccineum]
MVDEEEVQPAPEPHVEDDEYNLQRRIQMSLEYFQAYGQAPVGGVAIREPEPSKNSQKLKERGKGIATDEQAAMSLLDLHKLKKKSVMDQYILQRRILIIQDVTTRPS